MNRLKEIKQAACAMGPALPGNRTAGLRGQPQTHLTTSWPTGPLLQFGRTPTPVRVTCMWGLRSWPERCGLVPAAAPCLLSHPQGILPDDSAVRSQLAYGTSFSWTQSRYILKARHVWTQVHLIDQGKKDTPCTSKIESPVCSAICTCHM